MPPATGGGDGNTGETDVANYRLGRVALHLICILRGSDFRMHMAGVAREFTQESANP